LAGGFEYVHPGAEILVENAQRSGHNLLVLVVRQVLNERIPITQRINSKMKKKHRHQKSTNITDEQLYISKLCTIKACTKRQNWT